MINEALDNPYKGISLSESTLAEEDLIPYNEDLYDISPKEKIAYKKNSDKEAANPIIPLKQNRDSPVKAIDAKELINMKLPPKELIMSPWLPLRGIAMVYAPRGIGKTFFALEVACAVAKGKSFLTWATGKSRKVLYIDGEMGATELQPRLQKIAGENGLENGLIEFITPDFQEGASPDLSDPEWHTHLKTFCDKAELIIVDNISTLCRTGNENDAESWQVVQEWAIRLKSAGKTILFIHHAGKSGEQRGTSKREDVMDTVISLRHPDDYSPKEGARFIVDFKKARGFSGDEAESFIAQLEEKNNKFQWHIEDLEDSLFQKVISFNKAGMSQKDIAEELSVNKSTVSKYISRAKYENLM